MYGWWRESNPLPWRCKRHALSTELRRSTSTSIECWQAILTDSKRNHRIPNSFLWQHSSPFSKQSFSNVCCQDTSNRRSMERFLCENNNFCLLLTTNWIDFSDLNNQLENAWVLFKTDGESAWTSAAYCVDRLFKFICGSFFLSFSVLQGSWSSTDGQWQRLRRGYVEFKTLFLLHLTMSL